MNKRVKNSVIQIKKNSGIYIHIPFCRNKCDYCSFYSIPIDSDDVVESYVAVLLNEIDYISGQYEKADADTIYFGGGTPSILKPCQAEKIVKRISERFAISADAEVTLEMNPEDLLSDKLKGFTDAGVNRIVLGVQSLDSDMRCTIGRRGKAVAGTDLDLFFNHAGYTRCIDIMAGLPDQNEKQLISDLETITSYRSEHISLYLLSVDEGTPLGARFTPDEKFENLQADLWDGAMDFLDKKGYVHYEISNYALPGFESRHNSKYWDFTPFFGFGAGAHAYVDGRRYSCRMPVADYIKCSEFSYEYDNPSADSIIVEFIMTSLRRMKGFSGEEFMSVTGISLSHELISKLNMLKDEGKIEINNGRYYLSKKGLYLTDSIIYYLAEDYL